MADSEICCGFGGTFSIKFPDISNAMVEKKTERVVRAEPDMLLAGDLGCLLNIAGKLARQGFGRGLCVVDDRIIAAGSSPSTITLYDLDAGVEISRVNFSMDVRNAIHGLEVWPF